MIERTGLSVMDAKVTQGALGKNDGRETAVICHFRKYAEAL
jgi:hypothetical protein